MILWNRFATWLRQMARELADENAYARHLRLTGETHSPAVWRRFYDARLGRKYRQSKCC